ncbi:MAG: PqqD family protein [Lysobacter sp.]|nr:PqqD family protein [Lysobacter sp.]
MTHDARALQWDDQVQAVESQVSSRLGQEVAILELDRGLYFGLNSTGTRIWELLAEPVTVRDIHSAIVSEFEVDGEVASRDVLDLLEKLREAGLIRVVHAG